MHHVYWTLTLFSQFEDSVLRTVRNIQRNTKHYIDLVSTVIDEICAEKTSNNPDLSYKDSVLDVIIRQRSIRDTNRTSETEDSFPPSLTRR
jgi:DNA replication licensing factor MCM7